MSTQVKRALLVAGACLTLAGLLPAGAQAEPQSAWSLSIVPLPANFSATAPVEPEYLIAATNIGAKDSSGAAQVTVKLPEGLTPTVATELLPGAKEVPCPIVAQEVQCETTDVIVPGRRIQVKLSVSVSAAPGTYETEAQVSGGGAAQSVSATSPTPVQAGPVPFGILAGFAAPLSEEAGNPATLAGSHPYQQTTSFSFPTRESGLILTNDGYPHDFWVELPRGLGGDPAASPVLCTEAELTGEKGCPPESQVGVADVITTIIGRGNNGFSTTALYNMVPPPGSVAELATNIADVGLYAHVLADVRSDTDYGIETTSPDLLALTTNPVFGVQAQIWGDPSAPAHDKIRQCRSPVAGKCPVPAQETAFLTTPADCPAHPLGYEVLADSWEKPFPAFEKVGAFYEGADLAGNPVQNEGCGALGFEPTLAVTPTTNLTDSPSGLDVTLHQPQNMKLDSRASSPLRDAAIRFPAGLTVNPAQASGLGACTQTQIGFEGEVKGGEEAGRLDFSK